MDEDPPSDEAAYSLPAGSVAAISGSSRATSQEPGEALLAREAKREASVEEEPTTKTVTRSRVRSVRES